MNKNANINIEYEARAMINEQQYQSLLNKYSKSRKPKKYLTNINTYFDYENLYLTEHHIVLRTREISNTEYELTLKIKGEKGDIELNFPLTYKQIMNMKNNVVIPSPEIKKTLEENGVDINRLKLITELKTERLEIQYKKHLFVIDKNYYNGKVDYNVEVESDSKIKAKSLLNKHILPFGAEYKNGYISKSRRAIYKL